MWAATEAMTIKLQKGKKVEVTLRESRTGQRRAVSFPATVMGQGEDGSAFEERTMLRDLSLNGAYLCLSHRPKLQSELRLLIETATGQNYRSVMSLRGTVVHRENGKDKEQIGVGVLFVEEPDPNRARD